MLTSGILGAVCATALFYGSSSAVAVKRDATHTLSGSLTLTFSSYSGDATPTNIHNVYMDGGGGGVLNGHSIAIFSDTTTTNSKGDMVGDGFVSNTAYYIPDTSNPLAMEGFEWGTQGVPQQAVPWFDDECPSMDNCQWWMWPNSGFATQHNLASDTVAYGMYDTGKRPYDWQYKTLAKLTANDTGLTITRPVQAYITSSFKYKWGWSVASHGDGYVHMFAPGGKNSDGTTNLYAAKVPWDEIEDTSKFLYYDGKSYTLNSESDAAPIASGYFSTGDVFYSDHYSTWLIVYMGYGPYWIDTIYVQYSTTGFARGPYSAPQEVVGTTSAYKSYNYDLHSYPKFFGTTSQELLMSWDYHNGSIIQMGKLTFDP